MIFTVCASFSCFRFLFFYTPRFQSTPLLLLILLLSGGDLAPSLGGRKNFSRTSMTFSPIFYSVRTFARIRQHYSSKYWVTNAWAVPHLKFLGDRPPSPPIGLPASPPIAAVVPRCLLGLTFPDFDLAPKGYEKPGYCGLDLI